MSNPGLFAQLLGDGFQRLSPRVREVHGCGSVRLRGMASVTRGRGFIARLLGRLAHLPAAQSSGPVQVDITVSDDEESWVRHFGDSPPMSSQLRRRGDLLLERIGRLGLRFGLEEVDGAVHWRLRALTLLGIRIPIWLLARGTARSYEEQGNYRFDVDVALLLIGPVIAYRGVVQSVQHVGSAPAPPVVAR